MSKDQLIGKTVKFKDGMLPDKTYKVIAVLENNIALCEDNDGKRWKFSKDKIKLV